MIAISILIEVLFQFNLVKLSFCLLDSLLFFTRKILSSDISSIVSVLLFVY